MTKPDIKETIHDIAYKVGAEGVGYWLEHYSMSSSGDPEFDRLASDARTTLLAFQAKFEALREEHDAELG